jgi:hypothetical protein
MRRDLLPVLLCLGLAAPSLAAVDQQNRELGLPHVCSSGPAKGTACDPTDPATTGCTDQTCVVAYSPVRSAKFKGTITLTADDNVGDFIGAGDARIASTVLLQLKGKFVIAGVEVPNPILAQTYQSVDPLEPPRMPGNIADQGPARYPTLDLSAYGMDEAKLIQLATDAVTPGFGNPFVSRTFDCEISDELRGLFGTAGIPFVTKATGIKLTDGLASGRATSVVVKVEGRFVDANAAGFVDPCD